MTPMRPTDHIADFTQELRAQFATGYAQEHAYRPALIKLLDVFPGAKSTNDPKESEHGRPDLLIYNEYNTDIILGRGEAKDISVNLDKTLKTEQLRRYAGYEKLFLTNGLEFRFFQNGEQYTSVQIGTITDGQLMCNPASYGHLYDELQAFLSLPPENIRNGKRLALIMGGKARRIRDDVKDYFTHEDQASNQELTKIYKLMKQLLVHDLSIAKFADMYAQTLVYGLFAARYNDKTADSFTRQEAGELVPVSNPFLREFFAHISGIQFDKRLAHKVYQLFEVFSVSDVEMLAQKHLRMLDDANEKDPVIHFYEDFLKEYDPIERKRMGAYYTPIPVVQFMIRQVDEILRRDFNLPKGLADTSKVVREIDHGQKLQIRNQKTGRLEKTSIERREFHKVQILDPAVGTATFLNEIIKFVASSFKGQEGRWPAYTEDDLIPRLSGFELMMAPYTIAHLKLGLTLQESGITELRKRLGVYLTNTLEEGVPRQQDLFASLGLAAAITEEGQAASEIKNERPVMIIIGNPPYSGVSSNETPYANGLIKKYKVEPGGQQKLQERKHWLNDDYVKFMAFAEEMIHRNGEGIVAMITNNGYLDNPTFRGMRWHLAQTFDKIYILDLHGSSKKKEIAPDHSKDENVFDIQQGVGIILAVKTGEQRDASGRVFHAELFGKRQAKFTQLLGTPRWQELALDHKNFYFVPKNLEGQKEYEEGISLNELFVKSTTGIVTMGDNFIVDEDKEVIAERVRKLASGKYTKELLNREFGLGKNYAEFVLGHASRISFDPSKLVRISYRPFDVRWTYFDSRVLWRWREGVMRNLFDGDNVGLVAARQCVGDWRYVFITQTIGEFNLTGTAGRFGSGSYFPAYIYHDDGSRTPNFSSPVLKKLTQNLRTVPAPEDVLDYIYGVLHSVNYRQRYREFLMTDFPRVPRPNNDAEFNSIAQLGHALRELHLMKAPELGLADSTYPVVGSNQVERIEYDSDRVWINDTQYFGNVPESAWSLYIGGYQPAQRWLKDRRGHKLTNLDLEHYQKIIKALIETQKVMAQIDAIYTPGK